MELKSATTI
ncbi:unnamed protein product, partial [Allacma fusca]